MPTHPTALELLRGVGLPADGPVQWGKPVRSRLPGVFLVELPIASAVPLIDGNATRAWLERAPELRVDGERPTPHDLGARLMSFWLPGQRILYVGRSSRSLGGRVAAAYATQLGDRLPHSGGHWLKALQNLDRLRVWWSETDAAEEYEDALLSLFAENVPDADRAALPPGTPVLPWANLESTTGGHRPTGVTGSLVGPPAETPGPSGAVSARRRKLRPAAAPSQGASASRRGPAARSAGTAPRGTPARCAPAPAGRRSAAARAAKMAEMPKQAPTHLTAEGLAAVEEELDVLRTVRRPEVIARVKHARELGDLRENADYEAARNEQSFLEGRIRALEQMQRTAVVIAAATTGRVVLGSRVRVAVDDQEMTFQIVGSTEADPATGRISDASPVGRALLGHAAGEEAPAQLPGRTLVYRVLSID
jgi:transcription elongation factor GreA